MTRSCWPGLFHCYDVADLPRTDNNERWEPETTASNLGLIRDARGRRGETIAWARAIEDDLRRRAAG